MTLRMLLLLGAVALLALLTSWLSRQESGSERGQVRSQQLPDYFIKGFTTTMTDTAGRQSHRLKADSLYHYPADDRSVLAHPDITLIGTDNPDWHITAERGEITGDERQLMLNGNVLLQQPGDDALVMHTERLRVEPQRNYAETDAPVTVESASGTVHGIGMTVYGKEQRLQIHAAVRGTYVTAR